MFFGKRAGAPGWLAVFLGNPGFRYDGTRHNAGFMAGDALAKGLGIELGRLKFKSLTAVCEIGGERTLLLKPQTFMNLSGAAVKSAADFYKIPPERIIAVSDETALPPGVLRVKTKGSSGGHNGLADIIEKLGTEEFPRIRIGVGAPQDAAETGLVPWVLGAPSGRDAELIARAAERAAEAVTVYISRGPGEAMNTFNKKDAI